MVASLRKERGNRKGENVRGLPAIFPSPITPPTASWPRIQGWSRERDRGAGGAAVVPVSSGSASGSGAIWSIVWTSGGSRTTLDWCPDDYFQNGFLKNEGDDRVRVKERMEWWWTVEMIERRNVNRIQRRVSVFYIEEDTFFACIKGLAVWCITSEWH